MSEDSKFKELTFSPNAMHIHFDNRVISLPKNNILRIECCDRKAYPSDKKLIMKVFCIDDDTSPQIFNLRISAADAVKITEEL